MSEQRDSMARSAECCMAWSSGSESSTVSGLQMDAEDKPVEIGIIELLCERRADGTENKGRASVHSRQPFMSSIIHSGCLRHPCPPKARCGSFIQ